MLILVRFVELRLSATASNEKGEAWIGSAIATNDFDSRIAKSIAAAFISRSADGYSLGVREWKHLSHPRPPGDRDGRTNAGPARQ